MGKRVVMGGCLLALFLAGCSGADLGKRVHELTLPNGMRWLLVKRGYAPVFAGIVQVKVGGVDEEAGKTGLAHLLEHMAFKGTSEIGTKNFEAERQIMDEIDRLIEEGKLKEAGRLIEEQKKYIVPNELWDLFIKNGGTELNAYTTKDVTAYHVEMPNSKLELWIYLTSRMIADPAFREFHAEKDVVLEEVRTSIDNKPAGRIFKELLREAYEKSPYHWPTIGHAEDIAKLTRDDMKEFYRSHYVPSCMVGAIVGDIDIEETQKLLERYFGSLKGDGRQCHHELVLDPPQLKEKRSTVFFEAEPLMAFGFHKPTLPHYDDYIFDVFTGALCGGETGRLIKSLVKEKKLAKSVDCVNSFPGARLSNLFVVYVEPYRADQWGEIDNAVMEELQGLNSRPLDPDEFAKIKNQMKAEFLFGIDSNFELAHTLVYFENIAGSWRYVLSHPKNIDRITADDVAAAAEKYFKPENRTVVSLRRGGYEK